MEKASPGKSEGKDKEFVLATGIDRKLVCGLNGGHHKIGICFRLQNSLKRWEDRDVKIECQREKCYRDGDKRTHFFFLPRCNEKTGLLDSHVFNLVKQAAEIAYGGQGRQLLGSLNPRQISLSLFAMQRSSGNVTWSLL